MKLGAEPKKVAALAVLLTAAGVIHFTQDSGSGSEPTAPRKSTAEVPKTAVPVVTAAKTAPRAPASKRASTAEFKPVLKSRKQEDRPDPATVDPTLRLELIARLSNVAMQAGNRPLFEFGGAPPPPKAPDPGKIKPLPPKQLARFIGPMPKPPDQPPPAKVEPLKPKAPPIPLKYYGFTAQKSGAKRGFFLENEDVFLALEGDLVKRRYKVVRINLNSVTMSDTQFEGDSQTLPLVEQMQ
ncbi:MAG: hypothetical protein FJW30_21910 [Acidobacteria bacterium]|nr:hypothetical protein [Acidobacteriota bacterium]